MFGLGKKEDVPVAEDPQPEATGSGKGRPTPKRREAEEARKQALKGPSDPKARRKVEKERARQERMAAREALMAGDERHLPARDAGPVRKYVRDYIDGRWTLAEFFIPLAVVVLVASLFTKPQVQQMVSYVWFLMLLLLLVDMSILMLRLRGKLKSQFPDPDERRGALFYGAMRAMQIRRLRLPPPKVKPGGKPVTPKVKKSSQGADTGAGKSGKAEKTEKAEK